MRERNNNQQQEQMYLPFFLLISHRNDLVSFDFDKLIEKQLFYLPLSLFVMFVLFVCVVAAVGKFLSFNKVSVLNQKSTITQIVSYLCINDAV